MLEQPTYVAFFASQNMSGEDLRDREIELKSSKNKQE